MKTLLIICAILLALYFIVLAIAIGTEAFLATRDAEHYDDDAYALHFGCHWQTNRLSMTSRQIS